MISKSILILIIASSIIQTSYAQNINPFLIRNQRELKWMDKNGFDVNDYKWKDGDINYKIDLALRERKKANTFLKVGGIAGGIIASWLLITTQVVPQQAGSVEGITPSILLGVAGLTTVYFAFPLNYSNKAKVHLNNAEQMRRNKKRSLNKF